MTDILPDRVGVEGGVKSVTTALFLLESFTGSEELGISELARELGVAKSTAHRLITTLVAHSFVERNPATGRYRLGLQMYELGMLAVSRMTLRRAALPVLEELRVRTRGIVQLAVPDEADIIYLERLQSLRGLRLFMPIGMRLPAHATSCGRALAAFNSELAQARRAAGFAQLTTRTLSSTAAFDQELRTIARQGYAASIDTVVVGLSSVAAPIFDRDHKACAALSVSDITEQLAPNAEKLARLVVQASKVISSRIML